jgi:hypothetical protein
VVPFVVPFEVLELVFVVPDVVEPVVVEPVVDESVEEPLVELFVEPLPEVPLVPLPEVPLEEVDESVVEPVVDELPLESDVVDDPVPLPEFVEVVEELSSVVCELLEVSDVLWGLLGALVDFVSSTTVVWSSVEDDPSLVPMPAPWVARFTMMA